MVNEMIKDTSYYEIYYQPENNPVFSYRSGLLTYEETLKNGVLISSGYNTAGYPLNVLSNYPSRNNVLDIAEPSSFNIEIDGQCIDYNLEFVDYESVEKDNAVEGILTLESKIKPIRLKIHTILDGTQMFTRYIEIENLSDSNICLSRLSVLSGCIEQKNRRHFTDYNDINGIYSVGYFGNDAWGREGEFIWRDLMPDTFSVNCRFERDRFRHPLIFIKNKLTGTVFFSQIAWSGGCRFSVDYNAAAEESDISLCFKAEITAHNPLTVIPPKSSFVTPEVHMGAITGGLDDAVNEMHDHIRKSVLNLAEASASSCFVGGGMGAEHDMSVETTKSFMRQLSEMGAEAFYIDAGWQCPPARECEWHNFNGNNLPDTERYPNGMKELSDYCHSLGMKFGLWVDFESLGQNSEVFSEHPEWRAENIFGNKSSNLIDLSNPEAAEWAENELSRIIRSYELDLLRVDHNVSYRDYFTMRDTGSGIPECLSVKHFNAVYKMYRNLKLEFPEVIFENCAGGGGRTDLGMMKSFNHTWVSDWQRVPRAIMITNGMTIALPPERVDRLFAGMGGHEFGSLDMQMRNVMLTHMSLNVISPVSGNINPVQMSFIKHSIDIYKNYIRSFLPYSRIYHHTPDTVASLRSGFSALEVSSRDKRNGALAVFAIGKEKEDGFLVVPKGIDPSFSYTVTFDNLNSSFVISGFELMKGIKISIPSTLSSELILYKAN